MKLSLKLLNTQKSNSTGLFSGSVRIAAGMLAVLPLILHGQDSSTEGEGDIFELSPFAVETDSDIGYMATQTLSGTRMRSNLSDIGAPVHVLTQELLNDIGATNMEDVLDYAPNTSSWSNNFLTEPEGTAPRANINYQIRGFPTSGLMRDYFNVVYKPDAFNTERMTFALGPNAVLYGQGNPAGMLNTSSKRAQIEKRTGSISTKIDSEGSLRGALDINLPVISDRLAVRVAAMSENRDGWRDPDETEDDRIYIAATAKLTDSTILRANFESGERSEYHNPPFPAFDGYTTWIEQGSQPSSAIGTVTTPSDPTTGIDRLSNTPYLVVTNYGPIDGGVTPMSWRRMGTSGSPIGSVILNRSYSLLDEEIIPHWVNVMGEARRIFDDFENFSVSLEQKITQNLSIELSYNHQDLRKDSWDLAIGPQPTIRIDVNEFLPSGDPNPNLGKYFIEAFNLANYTPNITTQQDTYRALASYTLDLTESSKWLGRHHIAGMVESVEREEITPLLDLHNTSPAKANEVLGLNGGLAFKPTVDHPWNRAKVRYYIDPANDIYYLDNNLAGFVPELYSGDSIPEADPSGFTPAFVQARPPSNFYSENQTFLGTVQSFFLDDKLVTTLGWRNEEQDMWVAAFAQGSDRLFPDPHSVSAKDDYAENITTVKETTSIQSVVYKPVNWMSLTFNMSESFLPPSGAKDIYGNLLPETTAENTDFGIRFNLMEERVYLGVNFYNTESQNLPSAFVRVLGGNPIANTNRIFDAIASYTGDDKYKTFPYKSSGWSGVMDQESEGMEFVLTANPTPQWRLSLSVAQQETTIITFAPIISQYVDEVINSEVAGNSEWMALATALGTVADEVAAVNLIASRKESMNGVVNTTQPEWSANLITNYRFSKNSILDGFSVGGSLRYRSARGIGYPETTEGKFDTTDPFKGDSTLDTGMWVSYTHHLSAGKRLVFQLNVYNLFNSDLVVPHEAVWNDGAMVVNRYRLNAPRRYSLSATLHF